MRNLGIGLGAGACAGSLVGGVEALLLLQSRSPAEYQAFGYGYTLYGLAGALLGLVVGVGLWLLARDARPPAAWSAAFVLVFTPAAVLLGHHALDVGPYEGDGVPTRLALGLGAGALLLALFGWAVATNLLTKTPLYALTSLKGMVAGWGGGLLLAWIFALSPAPAPPDAAPDRPVLPDRAGRPDVFVLVLDGWRADTRGRAHTPRIDEIAAEGVDFRQHVVSAPSTGASVASLFTSMAVASHGATGPSALLPPDVTTLAEVLAAQGYRTYGAPNNAEISGALGFGQGFDRYAWRPVLPFGAAESSAGLTLHRLLRDLDARHQKRRVQERYHTPAVRLVLDAVAAVRDSPGPTFTYLHLMESHEPWFRRPLDGQAVGRADDPWPSPSRRGELRALYEGSVRAADAAVGELRRALVALGRWDAAAVVITSDHGVELYDHEGWWNGETLYDEAIHVPLVVKLPGGAHAGAVAPWQVRQIDVAPTLADLAGAVAPATWQGQELFPDSFDADLALGLGLSPAGEPGAGAALGWERHPASRDALAEANQGGYRLAALRRGGRKALITLRTPKGDARGLAGWRFYDLMGDPGERNNRAAGGTSEAAGLRASLEKLLADRARKAVGRRAQDVDPAERCRLCALGYYSEADCVGCGPSR